MSEPLRFVSSLLPTGVMIRLMGPAISVATALCSLWRWERVAREAVLTQGCTGRWPRRFCGVNERSRFGQRL